MDVKQTLLLCDGSKISSSSGQGVLAGNIRVATIHSIGRCERGDFLSSRMKAFPALHIHVEYRRFDGIYDLVLKEKVDLGINAFPEKHLKIETINDSEDGWFVILAKGRLLSSRKTVLLEQIDGMPFIDFDEGFRTRETTDRIFRERGMPVDVRMTNDNTSTIKKAVEAGNIVSIVPPTSINKEVQQGTIARLGIQYAKLLRPCPW
jgi:DNA-binding transcriptional LysR family regulator